MTTRAFVWLATNGGTWSVASNWDDVTDGIDPSLTVPGILDDVTVAGPTGAAVQTIAGPGAAALALFSGNTHLSGGFTFTTLVAGAQGAGGLLECLSHDSLSAGTAAVDAGSLLCGGGAIAVSGTLTLGEAGGGTAMLYANGGGSVQAASLFMGAASAAITIDPTASVEVGTAGGPAAGALTIDAGAALSGQGNANAYGAVVNNGLITAQGGTLSLGVLGGTGTLAIAAGATLKLNGSTGAGQAVDFTGALATLAIATEFDGPSGTITGFAAGDAIDMLGSPISGASFAGGVLTLTYGGQTAIKLNLAGNFTGDVFLPSADGAGGTDITLAPAVVSTGGPSPGTSTPDNYVWAAAGAGAWNVAANWQDTSKGQNPAAIAPGVNDLVTITGGATEFLVVAGPGNAASLSVAGALALSGAESIGTLAVGSAASPAVLDLMAGAVMQAQAASVIDGAIDVSGHSASLGVAGTLLLGGGPLGVGLPTAALNVSAGASVTLGGLSMGGGSGASVTTDPTSILVIGGGRGTAGAVTVAAGATLSGNGSVNPFAAILDNGLIDAAGSAGTLTLGTVTGTGTLLISAGAALELMSPTAVAIDFAAQSGSLYPVLDLASELALPTGTLSGLAPGDVIDVLGDPITSVAIARNTNGPSVLTLFYGSTVVGRISLLGGFAHQVFVAEPDASDGTDIVLVQQAGGGGGGGTGNTDTLAWATPGSGAWSRAGNWTDLTTGAAATAAPGAENQVIVGGPTGGAVQALGGPGTCSSLLFTGNTLLNGTFTTTTLTIGTVSAAGTLDEVGGDQLAATTATLAAGELSLTNASTGASIAGTLSIGGSASALLSVTSTAQLQAGALVLGAGGSVSVDATGSIEIGTLGGAAGGALTIDPRAVVSGAGTLNAAGTIIDNGSIEAIGGTLTVGAVSGAGTLDIGAEATLVLAVADPGASACQIVIQGGGATLDLAFPFAAGAQPLPSIIAGFAPGDALVIANAPITGVSVTQGSGLATLTLSYGAQNAATLLLAGNFANDSFAVQPDGAGSEITVTPSSGGTGPSAGTPSPDDYFWSGADTVSGGTAWNDAGNWNDASASQTPALIAPGLNDLVTIQGASGSGVLAIQGPGNAASLTLLGNVALAGAFAVGGLTVDAGILALGAGTGLVASAAEAVGGIEVQGGTLSVAGALDLAGGSGSLLVADAGASASIGTLFMTQGSAVLADATSSIGIGGVTGGTPGDVTVASGGRVSGAGALDVLGAVTDDGTITAAGGTLSVGAVSGDGTLLIGQGATLGLEGPAGSGLIIDFAANGTLSATVTPAAAIAGFGTSDAILLPFPDATGATYAPTDAGTGLLTITDGSAVLGVLTLLGMNADSAFSVTGAAGGGTELTTTTAQNGSSGGGSTVSGSTTPGGQVETDIDAFINAQSSWGEQALYAALATIDPASEPFYVWTAPGGQGWGGPNYFDVNIAFASDPAAYDAEWMPYGYQVLIASGNNPVYLVDGGSGHSLLIGNAGNDSITGLGQDDTMFGGAGTNTDFWAAGAATMVGGGNDTFVAQNGAVDVTTSANGRSSAWLGNTGGSLVTLNGSDTVAFGGTGGGSDTVVSAGNAGDRSLIVGPDVGLMTYQCGPGPATIVGHAGSMSAVGAGGSNFVIGGFGANSYLSYTGGSGGALVVGETGTMWIAGGAGAVTIFGGTGAGHYSAEPGPSYFVVGDGPSTIFATSGNTVWLEGGADVTTYVNGGGVIAWGANSSGNNVFQAGTGPSTLAGGMGSDLFLASTGNATLAGGSGVETFSFTKGQAGGHDLVQNFAIGRDVIALNGYGETPAMILAAETVSGGSTYLVLGDGTHITLSGVTGLTAASFTG